MADFYELLEDYESGNYTLWQLSEKHRLSIRSLYQTLGIRHTSKSSQAEPIIKLKKWLKEDEQISDDKSGKYK